VALTVVAPLVLLARALRASRRDELRGLLRYWRASSLLMVTVYLLIGERRVAFPAGLAARLLIGTSTSRHCEHAEACHFIGSTGSPSTTNCQGKFGR